MVEALGACIDELNIIAVNTNRAGASNVSCVAPNKISCKLVGTISLYTHTGNHDAVHDGGRGGRGGTGNVFRFVNLKLVMNYFTKIK